MVAVNRIVNKPALAKAGGVALLVAVYALTLTGMACGCVSWAQPGSAPSIPASALVQPQELNRILHTADSAQLVILQVGSRVMFDEAHIRGAEYAGPGSQETGLNLLRQRVSGLKRGTPIVIYCGCCPWNHCPNIWPAYQTLVGMGFKHVRALYLANNFGTDWANKGFPIEARH
jgi:thiosulfate/3-mercaptopyruvate sulfurtransferase